MQWLVISLVIASMVASVKGQTGDGAIRAQVLELGIVDSTFVFGKWTQDGRTEETQLTYLGELTTSDGRTLKVMNSTCIWGYSRRATNRILVFDGEERYIGNYPVGMTYELPSSIESGQLVFRCMEKGGGRGVVTKVDLSDGLLKEFFVDCWGEVYSLNNEP
ncbi:MAG: hypothetical protein KF797_07670 [Flavobacteriales bacterium]|nr:hypothetical protein [Flavobacteriales bacterium]